MYWNGQAEAHCFSFGSLKESLKVVWKEFVESANHAVHPVTDKM